MKQLPWARIVPCTLLIALAAVRAAAAPSVDAIEASMRRAMEAFAVPGMAVSVVHRGETVFAAGSGVTEAGGRELVDERTLFQIGSVSKAFTAAALAVLVDAGELAWDDRVIDHLPEFRMYDPWVTRELTIRDLLTHRSGLPLGAGDLLLFPDGESTPADVIHALRHLQPASSFRSRFAYDNLLYVVAGEVVSRVSGMPFADFLEQRLLKPLGMAECVAALPRVRAGASSATPHLLVDGELETTTSKVSPAAAAAGGINCNARSMTRWMSLLLGRGTTRDGVELISEGQFQELLRPVTLLPVDGYLAEHSGAVLSAYALGWGVSTFHGQPIYSHGGGVWGMTTFIAVLPEQELAVFASNNLMSAAPRAVVNAIIEEFLQGVTADAGQDWITIVSAASRDRAAAGSAAVARAMAARIADSEPALPLAAYAGTYRDPWYGDVHIRVGDDGRLWFHSPRNAPLEGPLEHFQHDTFIVRWTDRQLDADAYVSFVIGPQGDVESIRMAAVSPTTDFSYDFHDLDLRRAQAP